MICCFDDHWPGLFSESVYLTSSKNNVRSFFFSVEVFSQEVSLSVKVCCTCFADALDEPNNKSIGQSEDDFYATSLGYLAEQFESHAVNITQRLQQLDHSSEDFVSILY